MTIPAPEVVKELLEKAAYDRVLAVRGSWDAPGFDACVKAEFEALAKAAALLSREPQSPGTEGYVMVPRNQFGLDTPLTNTEGKR
jgi:hypothetical protein